MRKLDKNDFIKSSNSVHKNYYDYSLVDDFKNVHCLVKIICPKHGIFEQRVMNHKRGEGCKSCGVLKRASSRFLKTEDFIRDVEIVHDFKYDYSKTVYVNAKQKLIITCKTHGDFEQVPNNHKSGQGCPKCCGKFLNNFELIKSLQKIRGSEYDYSSVNVEKDKLKIRCKKHGFFYQTKGSHILGKGCPKC